MSSRLYNSLDRPRIDIQPLPVLKSTRFRAAIFDLDGTLVNSEGQYLAALRAVLTDRGVHWSQPQVSGLLYGRSWFDVFRAIEVQASGVFDDVRDLTNSVEDKMLSDEGLKPTAIYGSVRLLSCLSKLVPTSIVSGSSRAQVLGAAAAFGIVPDLACYLGYEDYSAGKPSPSGFKEAARQMDVSESSCVVFEDSAVGVAAAKRAGMFCIALARPDAPEQELAEAHLVVNDLCDAAVLDALR